MSDDAKSAAAKELKTFPCDRQLLSARFSPCGKFLASGAMDRVVMRWSLTENELPPLPPLNGGNGWLLVKASFLKWRPPGGRSPRFSSGW